jgi:uncharacterized membrane protein
MNERRSDVPVHVAIAYPNDSVTTAVVYSLERLASAGALQDASVAVIVRDAKGRAKVRRRRALDGRRGKDRIDEAFLAGVADTMPIDAAAVVLTAGTGNPDRVVEELVKFRGSVVRTNLDADRDQRLRDVVGQGSVG